MSTGLRERKKQATRQALAVAALDLAERHGPDRVTIEAISEAADVSPRTFFNYFASKEEAILDIDRDRLGQLCDALAERPTGEPALASLQAVLVEFVSGRVADVNDWQRRTELVEAHASLLPRHLAGFAEREHALTATLAARLGTDPLVDPYPELVVTAALAAVRVGVRHWRTTGFGASLPALLDACFDHLAAGLEPAAPRTAP